MSATRPALSEAVTLFPKSAVDYTDHLRTRAVVEFPPPQLPKSQLDTVPGCRLEQGTDQIPSKVPSSPNEPMILCR